MFGTIDSWLAWNLTGLHVTDVTNASRTQLMNLETLDWDDDILAQFGIPRAGLPAIKSSSEVYGVAREPLRGTPLAGILGDQQAALFGQACLQPGQAKNTYGTGCFLLMNTGEKPFASRSGLLTTLGFKLGEAKAVYALEGSIAIAGALVQWLRDNLGLIGSSAEIEALAASAPDNGDVYFVPAFSGLYAPHWRSDARGVIAGLTGFADRRHIARAALEATAYQTREVLDAMARDSQTPLQELRVDGGMVVNEHADAIPERHSRRSRGAPEGDRDDGARRRLCRGPRGRILVLDGRYRGKLGGRPALDAGHGRERERKIIRGVEQGRAPFVRLG